MDSNIRLLLDLYRTSGRAEYPIVLYEYQPGRKAEQKTSREPSKAGHGWRGGAAE